MTAPRFDLFTTTHKALRNQMNEFQGLSGKIDYDDEESFNNLKTKFEWLWKVLHFHSVGEDKFVFPMLEKVNKQRFTLLDRAHHDKLNPLMKEIEKEFEELDEIGAGNRTPLVGKFYSRYNEFLSDYYIHIREEEESLPIFWGEYSDAELSAEYMKMS